MGITVSKILSIIDENFTVVGKVDKDFIITGVKPISEANSNDLVWVSPQAKDAESLIERTESKVVICSKELFVATELSQERIFIQVNNPRLIFSRIVDAFFSKKIKFGIDKSARISPAAKIGKSVFIGPNCVIGDCTIKNGAILQGNNFIYDNVVIGENSKIDAGSVIGSDGFGYNKNENGEYEIFPHVGGVIIGNNVDIGANCVIDKGTLGNTIIGDGTKIDNLVHIAHNVEIGENVMIIGNCSISGSVKIGDNSWIAPQSVILDRVKIGENVLVGIGSVVMKDIPDNSKVAGNPARKIK